MRPTHHFHLESLLVHLYGIKSVGMLVSLGLFIIADVVKHLVAMKDVFGGLRFQSHHLLLKPWRMAIDGLAHRCLRLVIIHIMR